MSDIFKQSITSKTDMIGQLADALKEERAKRSRAEQRLSELECIAQEKHSELMLKRATFLNEAEDNRAAVAALRRELTALQKLVQSIEQISPEDEEYYLSLLEDQHNYNEKVPRPTDAFATPLVAGSAAERFNQRIKRIESNLADDKNAHASLLVAHGDSSFEPVSLVDEHSPRPKSDVPLAKKLATLIFARRSRKPDI